MHGQEKWLLGLSLTPPESPDVRQGMIDASYCLDAPEIIPAGAMEAEWSEDWPELGPWPVMQFIFRGAP